MANSLHFLRDKDSVLRLLRSYLRPGGRLLIVEYDTARGNRWVPYPFVYSTWEELTHRNGFSATQLLVRRSGSFFDGMYSALSIAEG